MNEEEVGRTYSIHIRKINSYKKCLFGNERIGTV
jgi:hypothetical protein